MNTIQSAPEYVKLPPTALQLVNAISLLQVVDPRSAALHLATPVGVVANVSVECTDEESIWRSVRTEAGAGLTSICEEASKLVSLGRREEDLFLDLSNFDPVYWCKPVISGARKILFGAGILFNAPVINADAKLDDEQLFAALRWWLDRDEKAPAGVNAGVVQTGLGPVLIWADRYAVRVEQVKK